MKFLSSSTKAYAVNNRCLLFLMIGGQLSLKRVCLNVILHYVIYNIGCFCPHASSKHIEAITLSDYIGISVFNGKVVPRDISAYTHSV